MLGGPPASSIWPSSVNDHFLGMSNKGASAEILTRFQKAELGVRRKADAAAKDAGNCSSWRGDAALKSEGSSRTKRTKFPAHLVANLEVELEPSP